MSSVPTALAVPAMPSSPRWALSGLALTMLMPSLATSVANIALPTVTQAFNATFQQGQWLILSFLLVTTALVVSAGRLGDVVGRRRLLIAGVVVFTAASALGAVSPNFPMLVAARAVQGVGAAAMLALTMALVGEIVPKERTGSAMGMLGTVSAVGTALGPSLGGILISAFGWHAIFAVNVPLGVMAVWLAQRYLPAEGARRGALPSFDNLGTATLAFSLAMYALSMTLGRTHLGTLNITLLVAAAVGLAAFIQVEIRASSPLVHLSMFRDGLMSTRLIMSALVSTVLMATLVVGPFYLSQGMHLTTTVVGLVMSVGPAAAALIGAPAGRLVDRFGSCVMMKAGLTGMAAGCSSLAFVSASLGVAGYLVPIVIITGSYAVFQAANNTGVMNGVPEHRRGVISGLLTMARNLGLITGASAMGAVFAAASAMDGRAVATPEMIVHGMHATFATASVLILAALSCATLLHRFFSRQYSITSRANSCAFTFLPKAASAAPSKVIVSHVAKTPSFQTPFFQVPSAQTPPGSEVETD